MDILTEIHRAEGINTGGKTLHRAAARAVVLRGRKALMVYSSAVGDYKFPGGGVDAGETHELALARELMEECGASLIHVEAEIGAIVEYNFPAEREFDVFKMTSRYYLCRVGDGDFAGQTLDDYEEALGFQPVWIDVVEAIEKNKSMLGAPGAPDWLRREIFALEYIRHSYATHLTQ